jgi:hypothetical protein
LLSAINIAGRMSDEATNSAEVVSGGPSGFVEYEIDIEKILRADLPSVLEMVKMAPLIPSAIKALPIGAKGAYVLYENGLPVYAGKTDTRHGFRDRLLRHASTIQHRHNLDPASMHFRAVRILVFSNFDVEAILINEMRKIDPSALPWNDSGFGSNDPGHNRETQKSANFDKKMPVDIDRPLDIIATGTHPLLQLLIAMKDHLPYTFRYETDLIGKRSAHYRTGHVDQREAGPIEILNDELVTLRSLMLKILAALPAGWRVTVFPDRVILYNETTIYPEALEIIERP